MWPPRVPWGRPPRARPPDGSRPAKAAAAQPPGGGDARRGAAAPDLAPPQALLRRRRSSACGGARSGAAAPRRASPPPGGCAAAAFAGRLPSGGLARGGRPQGTRGGHMAARQRQDEAGTLPPLALDGDRAAVRLQDAGGDRQAQSRPAAAVGEEHVEDALTVLRTDAGTVVLHGGDRLSLRAHLARYRD